MEILVSMLFDTGIPFNWETLGTDMVILNVDVYKYVDVDEIYITVGEGCLTQSSAHSLITICS